jgi:hypothetical protein
MGTLGARGDANKARDLYSATTIVPTIVRGRRSDWPLARGEEPWKPRTFWSGARGVNSTRRFEDKLFSAVTVEIKTGARTIISYLLSPLARCKQESLRER